MTNIEELLEQIKTLRPVADINLEDTPRKTRAGFTVSKRQAQEKMAHISQKYATLLLNSVNVFFVVSDSKTKTDRFNEILSKEGITSSFSVSALYERLTDSYENAMGGTRQYTADSHYKLIVSFMEEARNAGLDSFNRPEYPQKVALPTRDDAVSFTRNVIRENYGDVVNLNLMQAQIVNSALKQDFSGENFPVCLYGMTMQEATAFEQVFPNSKVVNLTEVNKIDRKYVANLYVELTKGEKVKENV